MRVGGDLSGSRAPGGHRTRSGFPPPAPAAGGQDQSPANTAATTRIATQRDWRIFSLHSAAGTGVLSLAAHNEMFMGGEKGKDTGFEKSGLRQDLCRRDSQKIERPEAGSAGP
jgi:hypothetical protein